MKNDRLIKKFLSEGRFLVDAAKGTVRNKSGRVLGSYDEHNGYRRTSVRHNGKLRKLAIHRIVWISVHGVPKHGTIINHRDTVKIHNWIDNLEKTTHAGNTRHAYKSGLCRTDTNHNERGDCGKFVKVPISKPLPWGLP